MREFLLRIVINAAALWGAGAFLNGIHLSQNVQSLLFVALIFGLINALVRPIIAFLTCPFYILTLGLFKFIVNALMLVLVSELVGESLRVDSFWWALGASIIISLITTILSVLLFEEPKQS
ncbi:MAG: phage holin family protein [Chloroflexota bacterium]